MFKIFIRIAVLLALVAGISACEFKDPEPNANAQCRHLDFTGNPEHPDTVTLTCDDGDEIVIPGPIEEGSIKASTIVSGQGAVADKSGPLYIASKSGKHYVWHVVIVNGEIRIFHDAQRVEHFPNGQEWKSKIAIRDFKDPDANTVYQAW